MLKEIVQVVVEITRADSCLIYILDSKRQQLVLRASKNPHPQLMSKIKMKINEGITGWVAKEKQPVSITEGASDDPRFKFFRSLPEDKVEAFLSIPILSKRVVIGVINVQHRHKHDHSQLEKNLLCAMGKLVGVTVENALLIEETLVLKDALEIRKLVEKAKGIIMKKTGLSEDESYRKLQQESMRSGKSLKEIAEAVLPAHQLKFAA